MSTWIFLRGLTRESRHWGDFPALFRHEIPAAGIVMLDLPGNGNLNTQRSPASVEALLCACRAQLLARGIPPPYHLLAMSLGAMVAVAWADRHPQELAGCVLINTSLRPYSRFDQRLRPANYLTLLRLICPGISAAARESAILRMTSRLAPQRPQIVAQWSAWQRTHPVTPGNALRQLWAACRYQAPPHPPGVNLLILAGAGDTLVNPVCSRQLAQRWQAAYVEHPGAGHDLPLDAGPWVARQVARWLDRTQPGVTSS